MAQSGLSPFEAPIPIGEGTFERDSLIWTLGKLAELTLHELFRPPGAWAHYLGWLAEEAHELGMESPHGGLVLLELELNPEGRFTVTALPERGSFVIAVCHPHFRAVIASAYGLCRLHRHQHGVCMSHFEGDAGAAARWAVGMQVWVNEQRRGAAEPTRRAAIWN